MTTRIALSDIDLRTGLKHDKMKPETEAFFKNVYAIVAPYQECKTWEAFEFVCCKNERPESDAPFFAYMVGRLIEWRKTNPYASPSKTKRAYVSFIRDYFRASPFAVMMNDDGTTEQFILEGCRPPTQKQHDDLVQFALIGFEHLGVRSDDGAGEVTQCP